MGLGVEPRERGRDEDKDWAREGGAKGKGVWLGVEPKEKGAAEDKCWVLGVEPRGRGGVGMGWS